MTHTESPDCELCGSQGVAPLYTRSLRQGASPMVRCGRCGLIFISPRQLPEAEEDFYRHAYYDAAIKTSEYLSRLGIFSHFLKKIRRYKDRGSILDVGCGPGHFLKQAGEEGWKTYGVEISPKAVQDAARLSSARIHQGSLSQAAYGSDFFDAVTFYNVLDQLVSPRGALVEVHRILKPGGLLAIRVPNAGFHHPFKTALDLIGSLGLFSPPISLTPFHLYLFSPVTLARMVGRSGFRVLAVGNAKVTAGDPGKTYGALREFILSVMKKVLSALAGLLYLLSAKRWVCGPSLELYAVKEPCGPRDARLSEKPLVSVVIPSRDRSRAGILDTLLSRLKEQDYSHLEILRVHGVSPHGKAINQGASRAKGEILAIFDDDSGIDDPQLIGKLVRTLQADPRIGMAGASIRPPATSNRFQKRVAAQLPRFSMPIVDAVTDSDFPCHGCCAIPISAFTEIGGEREDLIRGLDPDLRQNLRRHGYRVVLAPGTVAYHEVPKNRAHLVKTFFRNGKGSAFCQVFHPELAYDTEEDPVWREKELRRSFPFRILRFAARLARALLTLRLLRLSAYTVYACGYIPYFLRYSVGRILGEKP